MQTNEEHIEQQLWDYIDGICSAADKTRIALLIAQDQTWGAKHKELLQLHTGIIHNIELEQPPVRFTKNVMEAIAVAYPAAAPKQYINRTLMRGIAAFFIVAIVLMVGLMLASTDWSAPAKEMAYTKIHLPQMQFSTLFNGMFFNGIIAVNVILGLALLDIALRAKRPQHH